jgi:hypothetical protein
METAFGVDVHNHSGNRHSHRPNMSQSMAFVRPNMAETDPTRADFVAGQASAQSTASANATALIAAAIAALNLGTAASQAASAFDATGLASAAQTAAISSAAASLTAAVAGLSSVARSGSYPDLSGKPILGTASSLPSGTFATAAQGALAASALQSFTETDPIASPALTAHAGLSTTAHGGIVSSGDSRLTNARTPTAHKTTHATGGTDVLAPSDIGAATSAQGALAASALQSFTETDPVAGAALTTHAALTTAAHGGVVASSDGRLANSRTPTAHAASHASGGSDPVSGLLSADTGWTANSTAGDKTAALSSYSNGINSTIITALNLAAANSGTAIGALGDIVVVLVKQVAALRTALVASKLPNV